MEGPVEIRRRESIKPGGSGFLVGRLSSDGASLLQSNGGVNGSMANGHLLSGMGGYQQQQDALAETGEEDTVLAVNCRVCQMEIIINEEEGFVVKCPACNEATPIRNAPVGEKYVRCPCRCLLICKDSSEKIACPRTNCNRIITISSIDNRHSSPGGTATFQHAGTVRVLCVHCDQDFLFNIIHKTLAKCPHCSKISSVGNDFRQRQLRVYSGVALLFVLITGGVIAATGFMVAQSGGIVALYIGLVAISVLALVRVGYFCRMRVSEVQGAA